jgi:hypothetical protein
MPRVPRPLRQAWRIVAMLPTLFLDAARFLRLCLRAPVTLAAENLFLRKQLAMYQERDVKPKRATPATRGVLVWLSRWFDWREAWCVVQPETFSAGIVRGSSCSGGGNPDRVDPQIPAAL